MFKYSELHPLFKIILEDDDLLYWKWLIQYWCKLSPHKSKFRAVFWEKERGDTIFSVVKEDWLPACYQFVCEDGVKVRLRHDSRHSRFA